MPWGSKLVSHHLDGLPRQQVKCIIRRWDRGYDNHVQPGCAQICRIHGLLDHPPLRRRGACYLQRCSAFCTRLAEIFWNLVPILENAGRGCVLRALASCDCGGDGVFLAVSCGLVLGEGPPAVGALGLDEFPWGGGRANCFPGARRGGGSTLLSCGPPRDVFPN